MARTKGWIRFRRWSLLLALVLTLPAFGAAKAQATAAEDEFEDFSEIALEELLNVTVISASKLEQDLSDSPNAIWVITAEDIRRAGVRTIPEALSLAPGVYVARMYGTKWVVTIGGFAFNNYSNKLLVLVDGVSQYAPLFGGVEWEYFPVGIDEVERIEVIRGTGGVLYGANAANGVINIITKSPSREPSSYVNVRGGTQSLRETNAGANLSTDDGVISARLAVTYTEDEGFGMKNGETIQDGKNFHVVSLRTSIAPTESALISLDARYRGGPFETPNVSTAKPEVWKNLENAFYRARWDQTLDSGAQFYIQSYYWRMLLQERDDTARYEDSEDSEIADVEFQAMVPFEAAGSHRFIFGGGYRTIRDEQFILKDGEQDYTVANGYFHDEWSFNDQWSLNAGLKYESISLVDPTWQWRGAILYQPTREHGFRLAASNAYRSPALTEMYQNIGAELPDALVPLLAGSWPTPPPYYIVQVLGNEDLEPEQILSYEAGYRGIWFDRMKIDVSYAYKQYDNLISFYLADEGFYVTPPFPPTPFGPFGLVYGYSQQGEATSQNLDVGISARITRSFRVLANYSHVDIEVDGPNAFEGFEKNSPENYGMIGLGYTHERGFMADVSAYYVDEIEIFNAEDPTAPPFKIDAYWRLDARLAQSVKMRDGELEIGVVGTNLADEWHEEYVDFSQDVDPFQVRTGYYGYIEYRR